MNRVSRSFAHAVGDGVLSVSFEIPSQVSLFQLVVFHHSRVASRSPTPSGSRPLEMVKSEIRPVDIIHQVFPLEIIHPIRVDVAATFFYDPNEGRNSRTSFQPGRCQQKWWGSRVHNVGQALNCGADSQLLADNYCCEENGPSFMQCLLHKVMIGLHFHA